ncbi:cobyrinate a,c-diamide synthase [Thermopolyspora sp. NPDC052614]|uniref:cobyrinate a,c-diamide synthase n=1 Tax=Thermopolyspora sp. NPDC052614 TaxID=3155682 RepID=UPI0034472FFD
MTRAVPRLVIAAPSSGGGKTTVATGLMAALRARGLRVSPHKVGPDYIDPGYHALATGRPGRNLDPWLVGEDRIAPLFLHGARDCDIAIVEGVMGLFDGRGDDDFASTAHVARLLDAPVVLVVDVSRQSRSVAAVVHGFATFDPRVRLGGVILNRVGSPRHEELCRSALAAYPILGAIHRDDAVFTPSRHLGLIPAAERGGEAVRAVRRMGELIARSCDLEALVRLAHTASPPTVTAWDPAEALSPFSPADGRGRAETQGKIVAVAGGPAFTFGYAEHVELLRAAGAEVAVFDPLRHEGLPEGTGALVLGGGFPEVYAEQLAANERLREQLAAFDGPVAAECAGLLYLCRELDGRRMCGRIPAVARMTDTLTLGYREATALRDSLLTRTGEPLRGHEFHRTTIEPVPDPLLRWDGGADGHGDALLTATYLHLHWAGAPVLAQRLVSSSKSPSILR